VPEFLENIRHSPDVEDLQGSDISYPGEVKDAHGHMNEGGFSIKLVRAKYQPQYMQEPQTALLRCSASLRAAPEINVTAMP